MSSNSIPQPQAESTRRVVIIRPRSRIYPPARIELTVSVPNLPTQPTQQAYYPAIFAPERMREFNHNLMLGLNVHILMTESFILHRRFRGKEEREEESEESEEEIGLKICRKRKKCSICLSTIAPKSVVFNLKCRHFHHKACLERWRKINNSCPLCRDQMAQGANT